MQHIQAPNPFPQDRYTVFLSGSIAMGAAAMWQDEVVEALTGYDGVLLNPRRDDWDSTWQQSLDDPRFVQQVQWELAGLEAAAEVLMHFDPTTQSPITLLELGLWVRSKPLWISCPEGFWRKGNVEVVCQRYYARIFPSLSAMMQGFEEHLRRLQETPLT